MFRLVKEMDCLLLLMIALFNLATVLESRPSGAGQGLLASDLPATFKVSTQASQAGPTFNKVKITRWTLPGTLADENSIRNLPIRSVELGRPMRQSDEGSDMFVVLLVGIFLFGICISICQCVKQLNTSTNLPTGNRGSGCPEACAAGAVAAGVPASAGTGIGGDGCSVGGGGCGGGGCGGGGSGAC